MPWQQQWQQQWQHPTTAYGPHVLPAAFITVYYQFPAAIDGHIYHINKRDDGASCSCNVPVFI